MTPRRLITAAGRAGNAGSRAAGAFTLVEMLVAVAAIGIIALGLSRLFASTSATVKVGRRVSVMNEYAGMIERTMRADFQAMSRNGPLVIRHRDVGGTAPNGGVLLHQDERDGYSRRRRVDQMVFFVERPVASQRLAMSDDKFPIGSAARVYYGHGLKRELFSAGVADAAALDPRLDDDNSGAYSFGVPGTSNAIGPNEFASGWILLRHITALVPPSPIKQAPSGVTGALAAAWPDSLVQVGLQPATPSIFRNEVTNFAQANYEAGAEWARTNDPIVTPNVASGLVDVAAMDLEGVRSRIMQGISPFTNGGYTPYPEATQPYLARGRFLLDRNVDREDSVSTLMKKWMAMTLPAGEPVGSGPTSFDTATVSGNGGQAEIRMRAEPLPPDFTGNRNAGRFNDAEAYKRADQLMLSASNFVPGCTEFIVEWSFGVRFPDSDPNGHAGEIIWHGLPRYRFPDGDTTNFQDVNRVADVYRGSTTNTATLPRDRYTFAYGGYDSANDEVSDTAHKRNVESNLIHYPLNVASAGRPWPEGEALYSFFGLIDPSYLPPDVTAAANSEVLPAGFTGEDPFAPATLPWPWPKLVRVTISLVDPSDPAVEQTYQFIFDLPQENPSSF